MKEEFLLSQAPCYMYGALMNVALRWSDSLIYWQDISGLNTFCVKNSNKTSTYLQFLRHRFGVLIFNIMIIYDDHKLFQHIMFIKIL